MKTTAIRTARVLLWLVYAWVTIALVLLLLLFFLQLFGANPDAGFVDWVYRSTQRAMAPFRGVFEEVPLSDQSVLDVSVLFAMIVYAFVALGLHALVDWVTQQLQSQERRDEYRTYLAAQSAAGAPVQVVHLTGPAGTTATAVLQPHASGTSVELTASGLDPFNSYSAWLGARDGGRVSTAIFQPDASGTVKLSLATSAVLADCASFGLTQLPRAGETASTDVLASRLG